MNGLLTALAILAAVAVLTVVLAFAGGWRPGGRSRPTEALVRERTRRELGLSAADWREVRRAVDRGRAAPERLRPAAYELARRVAEVQRQSVFVRRPAIPIAVAIAVGLAYGAILLLAADDEPLWFRLLRPVPAILLMLGIPWGLHRRRRRVDAAIEANSA